MTEIVLKGRKIAKGKAKGEALVSQDPISFFGGLNSETGLIVEKGHQLEGLSVFDKVLIFPIGRIPEKMSRSPLIIPKSRRFFIELSVYSSF